MTSSRPPLPAEGRRRVVIAEISPQVECGAFPVKRCLGDEFVVEARVFADGHDAVAARLLYRHERESEWRSIAMTLLPNDYARGSFRLDALGRFRFAVEGWIDRFATWSRDLQKRIAAGQDVAVELQIGSQLVLAAAERARASGQDDVAIELQRYGELLAGSAPLSARQEVATDDDLLLLMRGQPDWSLATRSSGEYCVQADRVKARYSTWYEFFPRSCAKEPGRHGTFRDCEERLAYVAGMGFDVLYLPPIHPVGRSFRKGRNNAVTAAPGDVGSPWGIGAREGGHKAVLPELGTLEDFDRLLKRAQGYGIELALDIAFQCAPDHPYVKEHPEWFRSRPDGTIQYAENPPKKYQDIYPINFESDDWQGLWRELRDVFRFWIDRGVRIFRVDNPHTKAFPFWEWAIPSLSDEHPDLIFLSEAFTRPAVMYRLAKLGFTQSYTYFTWRNTKHDLTAYLQEISQPPVSDFFRPNLWPNTPDILNEFLQYGGRPAFIMRYVLAATLAANIGIYGPAYELCEHRPREPGSEEYLDSEKYEIRRWDLDAPHSLRHIIARVNRIRRENPALQSDGSLRFHPVDNEQLICYSKQSADGTNAVLTVVNLDPHHTQAGWIQLPLADLGIDPEQPYQAHDLLGEGRFLWHGPRNFVELNPQVSPAHIFRLRRRVRSESQFEYFL